MLVSQASPFMSRREGSGQQTVLDLGFSHTARFSRGDKRVMMYFKWRYCIASYSETVTLATRALSKATQKTDMTYVMFTRGY